VNLPPVRLSANDIEELIEVMKEDAPELDPRLTTEKYEFDSLKDFDDPRIRENPPRELHIKMAPPRSSVPMITVDVRPSGVTLHADADDALSCGMLIKAGEFLRSKQRMGSFYGERMRSVIALMLVVGMWLVILTSMPVTTSPPPSGPPLLSPDFTPIGAVLAGCGFIGMLWMSQIRSKIVTTTRVEAKHLVNWDRVIQLMSLAIAILTLAAGLLAAFFGR